MFRALLKADFKRVRFQHLHLTCAAYGLAVAATYLFAHNSSWVMVPTIDGGGAWGFLPGLAEDPAFLAGGGSLAEAIACASVAHTAFFPILALAFVYLLCSQDVQEKAARVSFARGASRIAFFGSKLVAATVVLQAAYLLVSCGLAALYVAALQPGDLMPVVQAIAAKLFLNCLVNESFVVFCMAVFAWMPKGPVGGGVVFVATFVGLIAQMANRSVDLPVHMGYWMKASGLGATAGMVPSLVVFSFASFVLLAAVAYAGIVVSMRR